MKCTRSRLLVLILSFASCDLPAQDSSLEQIRANSERNRNLIVGQHQLGAETLESLVDSSSVIVRGRYGAVVSNTIQYPVGQGARPSSTSRMTRREIAEFGGLPLKVVEIEIDEILKGNDVLLDATTLQLGLIETADEDQIARLVPSLKEFRSGEHLFFLIQNPNNSFALRGPMFDFQRSGGAYVYWEEGKLMTAFGSESSEIFLRAVNNLAD